MRIAMILGSALAALAFVSCSPPSLEFQVTPDTPKFSDLDFTTINKSYQVHLAGDDAEYLKVLGKTIITAYNERRKVTAQETKTIEQAKARMTERNQANPDREVEYVAFYREHTDSISGDAAWDLAMARAASLEKGLYAMMLKATRESFDDEAAWEQSLSGVYFSTSEDLRSSGPVVRAFADQVLKLPIVAPEIKRHPYRLIKDFPVPVALNGEESSKGPADLVIPERLWPLMKQLSSAVVALGHADLSKTELKELFPLVMAIRDSGADDGVLMADYNALSIPELSGRLWILVNHDMLSEILPIVFSQEWTEGDDLRVLYASAQFLAKID